MGTSFAGPYYYTSQRMNHIIIFLGIKFINLQEFFYEDGDNTILVNYKLEGYINKIQENELFEGVIEICIFAKILNINLAVY